MNNQLADRQKAEAKRLKAEQAAERKVYNALAALKTDRALQIIDQVRADLVSAQEFVDATADKA
jgi:hypothetical protein